jgi:hypothetical protein
MFQAVFSPIIRSTRLYLQHLEVFTNVAAGWCQTLSNASMTPAGSDTGEYYQML